MKPYEVELCVAEVGDSAENDQLYRLTFDGSIVDEPDFVVMGGQAEAVTGHLREHFSTGMGLSDALQVGVRALSAVSPVTAGRATAAATQLTAAQLEVAVLDRRRPKRAFRRVTGSALRTLLGDEATPDVTADAPAPHHAPSVPEPGTPPGLGDPANPDTAGGTEETVRGLTRRRPMATYRVNKDGVAKAREADRRRASTTTRPSGPTPRPPPTTRTPRSTSTATTASAPGTSRSIRTPPRRPRAATSSPTATSRRSTAQR